jgi:muramoyltetrapeptide carboxypeptidase LdcA involved in peptidoglycan recycling
LLEEIGERGYAVDRLLMQMKNAGCFNKVKAIVFGDFTGGDELDGRNLVNYALKQFAEENAIACFKGLKTGHGKLQLPVPLNTKAIIECSKEKDLRVSTKWY